MAEARFDQMVICPYCETEQLKRGVPLIRIEGDGRVYWCEGCQENFRVGMVFEPRVSKLRGA